MAPLPPADRSTRVMAGLAIAGAVPLTLGTIFWIVGTSLRLASHRGWAGRAAAGEVLVLTGLAFGLILIIVAVADRRGRPAAPAAGGQDG